MKRWCAALLGLALLGVSCDSAQRLDATARQRWAAAWIAALNSGEWSQVGPLLGSDGTYRDTLTADALRGASARSHFRFLWQRRPLPRFAATAVHGDERWVVIEWNSVPRPGEAAISGVFMLLPEGSGLREVRGYFDRWPMLSSLGALPLRK